MKRAHPEDSIQKAVCDHLRARAAPGVLWFHVPNGAKLGGARNAKGIAIQGARLKGLGVRPGVSDLILVHRGRAFALELKAPSGRATEQQMQFVSDFNAAGGFGTIASGLDEALRILEVWGLVRGQVQL
jgi:hypothetical protein